ncbi:MAG TPA: hypothetical protein VFU47_01530 [Armatimonadota bacterium]|nr:hypothetical protein [Armatimonadota bacterium]
MRLYRVRDQYKTSPSAIWNPETGGHEVPDPARQYTEDEPLVKLAPWYFIAEGEQEAPAPESVRIADVEQATRAPGEKRAGTRRKRSGFSE